MPFAQINYKQKLGSGNLTLSQAGCFVTADCNLLEKAGVEVDPATLDAYYRDHAVFSYDFADKANEDLSWWSVTKYRPQLTVKQIGTSAFPDSDLAQVEFRYRNHTGTTEIHFCAVHSAADHSIIDSYDGKVKTPAEYQPYYGTPVAWATFVDNTPQISAPAPSAPVSAPQAVAPSVAPPPASTPKQIFLPPSVWIWHVYKPGGPYTLPYAIHSLDPKMYGGLTYDIVGNPAPNIYLIQTQMFGEVAIYAGPDTAAQFIGSGHGEGEATPALPVTEVVPAPQPDNGVIYARFPEPMQLVTKPGALELNFISNVLVSRPDMGTFFEAVGKATLPNGDVYFMNEYNFGSADKTQHTPITVGFKTIDITVPTPQPTPVIPTPVVNEIQKVSVTVLPTADILGDTTPGLPWQKMYYFPDGIRDLVVRGAAGEKLSVTDFETGMETTVDAGTQVSSRGWFVFGGFKYYRAMSGERRRTWYGFPVAALEKGNATNIPFETGDDINQIDHELQTITSAKRAAIRGGATASALLARLKNKGNKNE